MSNFKKLLTGVLSAAMITTSLAVPALADEAGTAEAGSTGTTTTETGTGTTGTGTTTTETGTGTTGTGTGTTEMGTGSTGTGTGTTETGTGTTGTGTGSTETGTGSTETGTGSTGTGAGTTGTGTEGQETKAAKIGDVEYETLAAAVAVVGESETTITLLKNVTEGVTVPVGKKVILDLNGKNITVTDGCAIVNKGALTVRGDGEVSTSAQSSAAVANFPDANVTLNGGRFISTNWYVIKNLGAMTIDGAVTVKKPENSENTASLIDNGWVSGTDTVAGESVAAVANKASLTIKNGSFEGKSGSKSCSVVKNDDYGILNIEGGTFDSTNNTNAESSTTILNWNVATISGGTFKGQYPLSVGAYTGDADKGQLTVSGGTFIGVTSIFGKGVGGNGKGAVNVSGGTFTTTEEGSALVTNSIDAAGGYTLSITGGEFGGKLTAESITQFCASGFVPELKDGKYTIKNTNKVKIGDNFYLDLKDALEAAESNAEIVLIDDIEYPAANNETDPEKKIDAFAGYIVEKAGNFNVSINGNGHKIITNVTGDTTPQIGIKSKNGSLEVYDVVVPHNLLFTVDGENGDSLYVSNCTFNGSNKGAAPNVRTISYCDNKFEPTDENAEPLSYTGMDSTRFFDFYNNTVTAKKPISLSDLTGGDAEQKGVYFENNKITNKDGAAIVLEAAESGYIGKIYVENNSVDAQTAILLKNPTKMIKTTGTGTGTEATTLKAAVIGSDMDNEVTGTFIDYDKTGLTEEADKTAAKDAFDTINDNKIVLKDERPVLNAPYDKLIDKRFNASVLKKEGKDGVILTKPDKYKDNDKVGINIFLKNKTSETYDGTAIKLKADEFNVIEANLFVIKDDNTKALIPYSQISYCFYPVTLDKAPETSLYQNDRKTTEYKSGTKFTLVNEYTEDDPDSKVILFYTTDGSDPITSTTRKAYNGEELSINGDITVKTVYMSPCLSCEKCLDGKYAECENPVYGEINEYEYTIPKSSDKSNSSTRRGTSSSFKGRTYTKDIFGVEHKSHVAYIKGYSDGTVRPNETITREEIAEILYRVSNDAEQITAGGNKFGDVAADRWSAAAIEFMAEKGVITGYEDGSFKPSNNLTRAEFAALISRFASLYNGGELTKYTDVDDTSWAYKSIMALTNAKIMNGYEDGSFRPENNITRAEVMTVINKILGRYPSAEYIKTQNIKRFSDLNENDWYYAAVVEATTTHDYYLTNGTETSWENVK